jgi:hypothetical protein
MKAVCKGFVIRLLADWAGDLRVVFFRGFAFFFMARMYANV